MNIIYMLMEYKYGGLGKWKKNVIGCLDIINF